MPTTLVLAYPRGAEVDLAYYTGKHLAIALPALKQAGLKSWRVSKAAAGDHEVIVFLEFDSLASIAALSAPGTEASRNAAAEDLPNYSKLPPVRWVVEEIASEVLVG